jgi:5,10-methylenetetrahydrofolate reductase
MTRYQMQHEIFTLSMAFYPECQHEEIYAHLEKKWQMTDAKLAKYLEILKTLTGE